MAVTHEERSHSAARPHDKMWPGFGGYESGGGVIRQRSWPPDDANAFAPGIAGRRGCNVAAVRPQFMKHNDRNNRALAREARREPNGNAVRRSGRLRGYASWSEDLS